MGVFEVNYVKMWNDIHFYIVSLLLLPYTLLSLFILYIYKEIVMFIIRLRNSNITEMSDSDVMFGFGENHHHTIDVFLVINSTSTTTENVVEKLKKSLNEKILKFSEKFPKMTSILKRLAGHCYLVTIPTSVNDYVKVIKIEENDELYGKSMGDILDICINKPMPLNNTLLWETVVIDAPISWKIRENLKENQFPVLFRLHHVIGDGNSIMKLFVHIFADNSLGNCSFRKNVPKNNSIIKHTLVKLLQFVYLISFGPTYFTKESLKHRNDVWDAPKLSHKRQIVYAIEKDMDLIATIKSMKKEMKGTRFTDILLTAISASLQDYFEQVSQAPEYVTMVMPFANPTLSIETVTDNAAPELKNDITFILVDLCISLKSASLIERLRKIESRTEEIIKSPQPLINYFMATRIMKLFPEPIFQYGSTQVKMTTSLSNLPGLPKISLWNGDEIGNICFFTPSENQAGIGFSLLTYDNRCHFGLSFDEAVISSKSSAQKILNDVLKKILLLNEEIVSNKKLS